MSDNAQMIPAWIGGTLTPVEKLKVHREGLRHKAVSIFVVHRDKILLQQRALTKYHTPGLWANTCCTHPLWEETAAACATRRLREELGIIGLTSEFRDHIEYRADVGDGMTEHEVVDIFVAAAPAQLKIAPNPNEVAATRWISFYDLARELETNPEKFTAWLRIYMDDHMEQIFGALVQA